MNSVSLVRLRLFSRVVCNSLVYAIIYAQTQSVFLSAAPYSPPITHRADLSLDSGWRFICQDVAGAQTNGFDDSSWSLTNLPHTWNNLDGQDGGNNYYRGIGWYRTHYTPDNSYAGRRFFLKFDAARLVSDVWLYGKYLGQHHVRFAAFVFDVSKFLNVGLDKAIL